MGLPDLGVGVGLRIPHYPAIFERWPAVDWFEIISENFMVPGGRARANLDRALSHYRLVQHGVSLSIGGPEPLDTDYLRKLKSLTVETGTPWFSDHLCWTGNASANLHDLLPLPYTEAVARYVADRIRHVQDVVGLRFVIENVSSYMTYRDSQLSEWEFVGLVAELADCGILLDVNNIYVSSFNHGFDPATYIAAIPQDRVVQMHLAGHTHMGRYIIDTHSAPVIDEVWKLYALACERFGRVSTLVEWDDDIPPLDVLLAEARRAKAIREGLHHEPSNALAELRE